MNNHQQQLLNEAPIILRSNDLHIIEEDSENEEHPTEQDRSLEDALEAWNEINSLVRNIGRSLITREVVGLKRSAEVITQRCSDAASREAELKSGLPSNVEHQQGNPPPSSPDTETAATSPSKRRRVSGFTEGTINSCSPPSSTKTPVVQVSEQQALVRRMNRMRRMNAILLSINNSHGQLEEVIRDMMNDEEVSHE